MTVVDQIPENENARVTRNDPTLLFHYAVQNTQNANGTFGAVNATTKINKRAQSFIAKDSKLPLIQIWKSADTGTFTGDVRIAIHQNISGAPSDSELWGLDITNATWSAFSDGAYATIIASDSTSFQKLVSGTTYWLVLSSTTADDSNHPNVGLDSTADFTDGNSATWNVTDGWTNSTTESWSFRLYFGTYALAVGDIGSITANLTLQTVNTGTIVTRLNATINGTDYVEVTGDLAGIQATTAIYTYLRGAFISATGSAFSKCHIRWS